MKFSLTFALAVLQFMAMQVTHTAAAPAKPFCKPNSPPEIVL